MYIQSQHGAESACLALQTLYKLYFEDGQHPSSPETLIAACHAAGLEAMESEKLVEDGGLWEQETRQLMEGRRRDGVDSVPTVVVEGRKRDFELVGAKEGREYVKVLGQVEKECV